MKTKQHYFFTSCIEGDLLICAGISKILREKSKNVITTLLMPEHPRVKNKMSDYYKYFDEVILLPFCQPMRNIYRGIKTCLFLIRKLKQIVVPQNSIFLMFCIYDLSEMLIYSFMTAKRDSTIKRISISAFESGESQPNNVTILLKNTILLSFYSLLFSRKLFFVYKTRNSSAVGIHYFPTTWDIELCFGNSEKTRSEASSVLYNVPYPVLPLVSKFLEGDNDEQLIKEESFVILVDSLLPNYMDILPEFYWAQVNNLINYLENNFSYKIVLKNHPQYGHDTEKWISSKNVNYINYNISAEDIYLRYLQKIKGIFGCGTTGLITASWLGINSYHVRFLCKEGSFMERLNKFMRIGSDIVHIGNLNELRKISVRDDTVDIKRVSSQISKRWSEIVDIINRKKGGENI